jgi:hypothetical protein
MLFALYFTDKQDQHEVRKRFLQNGAVIDLIELLWDVS